MLEGGHGSFYIMLFTCQLCRGACSAVGEKRSGIIFDTRTDWGNGLGIVNLPLGRSKSGSEKGQNKLPIHKAVWINEEHN